MISKTLWDYPWVLMEMEVDVSIYLCPKPDPTFLMLTKAQLQSQQGSDEGRGVLLYYVCFGSLALL